MVKVMQWKKISNSKVPQNRTNQLKAIQPLTRISSNQALDQPQILKNNNKGKICVTNNSHMTTKLHYFFFIVSTEYRSLNLEITEHVNFISSVN